MTSGPADDEGFDWDRVFQDLQWALEVKKRLLEHNNTQCRTPCPHCGGTVQVVLAGRKSHVHARCEDKGCINVME